MNKSISILALVFVLGLIYVFVGNTIAYELSYAIDYELGIAQECDGTDYAYETLGCKYDYSEKFQNN